MGIAKNSVVTLNYEMFDANDQLIDKTGSRLLICTAATTASSRWWKKRCTAKRWATPWMWCSLPTMPSANKIPELVRIEDVGVFPVEVEAGMMFEADDPKPAMCWFTA